MRQKPLLIRGRQVQADGSEIAKTIRADEIKKNTVYRHESLDLELKARAEKIWHRVGKTLFTETTMDKWVDDFRLETHPDKEVSEWERIADVFEKAGGRGQSAAIRREMLRVVCMASAGAVDIPSQTNLPSELQERLREAWNAQA